MRVQRLVESTKSFLFTCGLSVSLIGCGPSFSTSLDGDLASRSESKGGSNEVEEIAPTVEVVIADGITGEVNKFCSPLSFKNVTWDTDLTPWARRSLGIALSISGSYEGRTGWTNLTNNFDGMGLSAGLLNQTLGTGSLQPLLAQLRADHPNVYSESLGSSRSSSLLSMVKSWESAVGFKPENLLIARAHHQTLFLDTDSTALDVDHPVDEAAQPFVEIFSADSNSVSWAKNNLYDARGNFHSAWKSELQKLLGHPKYISLQIHAAHSNHTKALGYVNEIGINDLRTYLLMFDIVVQNGGIQDSEFTRWRNDVRARGLTTAAAKLKALIDIRIERVRSEYKSDVRSRKYAIIDGKGIVHGESRNLPSQYCYASSDRIL